MYAEWLLEQAVLKRLRMANILCNCLSKKIFSTELFCLNMKEDSLYTELDFSIVKYRPDHMPGHLSQTCSLQQLYVEAVIPRLTSPDEQVEQQKQCLVVLSYSEAVTGKCPFLTIDLQKR